MSRDCFSASLITRWSTTSMSARRAPASSSPSAPMPSSPACSVSVIHSAVAMSVLDGTTSVSTAEPPIPCRSTTCTSAPSWRATSAASYPPGPPPTMTTREPSRTGEAPAPGSAARRWSRRPARAAGAAPVVSVVGGGTGPEGVVTSGHCAEPDGRVPPGAPRAAPATAGPGPLAVASCP